MVDHFPALDIGPCDAETAARLRGNNDRLLDVLGEQLDQIAGWLGKCDGPPVVRLASLLAAECLVLGTPSVYLKGRGVVELDAEQTKVVLTLARFGLGVGLLAYTEDRIASADVPATPNQAANQVAR